MDIVKIHHAARQSTQASMSDQKKAAKKRWVVYSIALAVLAIIALGFLWKSGVFAQQRIDGSKYQVVYLTNGQAYFGKLQNTTGDYLYVMMPYTAQSVTPNTAGGNENSGTETTTTLLRVKDQVYGPEDSIAIRASQVAFWQNLRDDSKVAQAIKAKQ